MIPMSWSGIMQYYSGRVRSNRTRSQQSSRERDTFALKANRFAGATFRRKRQLQMKRCLGILGACFSRDLGILFMHEAAKRTVNQSQSNGIVDQFEILDRQAEKTQLRNIIGPNEFIAIISQVRGKKLNGSLSD